MRGLETVSLITKNKEISEKMKSSKVIEQCLFLYEKSNDDILEKLSVIEILKSWCENKNVLEVLG